jgi:allophanate hydrolase
VDMGPLFEAAALLYDGPWVAERTAALRGFMARCGDAGEAAMHPVVRRIVEGGHRFSAADLHDGWAAIGRLRKRARAALWGAGLCCLVVPTAPTHPTHAAVAAEPVAVNAAMGTYTNFVNLLDMAALAVPAGFRADGLPHGVTLIGPCGSDLALAQLGGRLLDAAGTPLGGTGAPRPRPPVAAAAAAAGDTVDVAVVGAHLSGQPLNGQLTSRGGVLLAGGVQLTAPVYRLFALPGTVPPKPGMVRVADGAGGVHVEVEVWRLPASALGGFAALIPPPLALGRVRLNGGQHVLGFLCEGVATGGAQDISEVGAALVPSASAPAGLVKAASWRGFQRSTSAS